MARVKEGHEFILARSSYCPEVALAETKVARMLQIGRIHKCQRTKWPEVVMARGRRGQRLKWPEIEVARG